MGTFFLDFEDAMNPSAQPRQEKKKKKKKPTTVKPEDIKQMFTAIETRRKPSNTMFIE